MKKEITYTEAVAEIEEILNSLDSETVDIDKLADKVKRAMELIALCRERLRKVEEDVAKVLDKE